MSRIAPQHREPVIPLARRSFTNAQRLAVLGAYNTRCAECGVSLRNVKWEIDHTLCLELGGKHEPANWRPLCAIPCHRSKTKRDIAMVAKARRLRKREAGEQRKTQPIRSRGFDRSRTRGFDGIVRERG